MIEISNDEFEKLIGEALDSLPGEHVKQIKNVAITWSEEPSPAQNAHANLGPHQVLLGLYEGVPLAQRQGHVGLLPDKITLFKHAICLSVNDLKGLKEQIRHTLWHEIAHYYGLDHDKIRALE